MKNEKETMIPAAENKKFGLSQKARKAVAALFLAGGLFGGQAAQASVPTAPATVPDRVAAVREALNKRVTEAHELGGTEAIRNLPYAQVELASWVNWINWSNWNNWKNWSNWSNWRNWINY